MFPLRLRQVVCAGLVGRALIPLRRTVGPVTESGPRRSRERRGPRVKVDLLRTRPASQGQGPLVAITFYEYGSPSVLKLEKPKALKQKPLAS
jgi:hypothetical protein